MKIKSMNFGFRLLVALAVIGVGMPMFSATAWAQQKISVSGVVTDSFGEPIIGAGVMSGSDGTITDFDGAYTIEVAPNATLVFSAIGYKTLEEPVNGRASINVTLDDDALLLEDAVVIGYGTQRKADITSSVASVKSDDFLAGNIGDAAQMIKGKVAGLSVAKGNGDPNSSSSIMLRGVTSLAGGYTPLVLVDGVEGSLDTVAPESIEEISVLKDASAAAIYGTRGASGVIIITTKAGKIGEHFNLTYSGYASASDFSKRIQFMDAEWVRWCLNSENFQKATPFQDMGATTDWLDEITRTGIANNHSITLDGGTQSMAYSANIAYKDNQGVIIGSYNHDLKVQLDLSQYMFDDVLKLNFNVMKTLSENDNQDSWTMYHQAVIRNPTAPIYTETGDYQEQTAPLYYYNPIPYNKEHYGQYRSEFTRLTSNITLEPISGWKTNLMLTTRRSNGVNEYYNTPKYQGNRWGGINGSAGKSQNDFTENMLELTSTYEKNVGKHRFSGMVGYSYLHNVNSSFGASNSMFDTDAYLYNNLGAGKFAELITKYKEDGTLDSATMKTYAGVSSYKAMSKLIGFFGRISYGYDNRYNVLISLRHEGSSKFGAAHRWGNFPSISAGWTLSNEDWLRDVAWLDNLKLRAGYGLTGVIPGSPYMSLLLYSYDTGYGNYVNEDGEWKGSLTPTQNPNPELKWETTGEYNVGLDFGFLDGKFYGSVDVYRKTTSDMLFDYSVPVPPNLHGTTTANVGVMRNQGVEVMLGTNPIRTKNVNWNTTFTMSSNKNTLVSLSNDLYETDDFIDGGWLEEPTSMPVSRAFVGGAIGNFYMLKSVGVGTGAKDKGMWLIEDPDTGGAVMFNSGMRNYDSKYRQNMGSGLPKVYLGWNNTVSAYNFDLSLSFTSALGHMIYNSQRMFYENMNIGLNRFKSATQKVYGTRLSPSQEPVAVSYYLEKGDYLKLNNATLGYTFNTSAIKYVDKVRAYIAGENLFCLTGYKGIDPELSFGSVYSFGVDYRNKYPTLRTFTVGVNVTFGNK